MHGLFHPKSRTLKLYTKRKEEGRGLFSFRANIQGETTKIQEYIRKMILNDDLLSKCLRQHKTSDEKEEEKTS